MLWYISLERSLQITLSWLAQNVNSDNLRIIQALDTHERLDEKWLGIFEVTMEEYHHGEAHVYATDEFCSFREVVVAVGCRDEVTGFFGLCGGLVLR